jgi:hypothetical protein
VISGELVLSGPFYSNPALYVHLFIYGTGTLYRVMFCVNAVGYSTGIHNLTLFCVQEILLSVHYNGSSALATCVESGKSLIH